VPDFLLDSAQGGSGGTAVSSWNAPSVDAPGDDVLLVGCLQITPDRTIDPPAGWTNRVDVYNPVDDIRMALLDRTVATEATPYSDLFGVTGGTCKWTMAQLAFRLLGGVPANSGSIFDGPYSDTSSVVDHTVEPAFDDPPTPGNVLLAYVVLSTYAGVGGGTGTHLPTGWQLLEHVSAGDPALAGSQVYYKVATGDEDTVVVTHNGAHTKTMSVLLAEYGIDIMAEAVGWDVYAADALLGNPLVTLENAKGRWLRSELHGLGEGGFAINRHADEATEAILAEGNMVKVRIPDCGPDYIDGFFLPGEGDYTLLSGQGGQGREDLVFRGLGALSYLDRARMTPCAYSIPPDLVGTWEKVWATKAVGMPSGVAFDPDESNFVYVIGASSRKIRKVNQTTREVASSSPALWSGSSKWAAGLSFDPDDDSICWVLEAPWLSGSTANTKIRKIRRSDWHVLDTWDLGDPVKLTDIRVDGDFVWTTRYDNNLIQQRSKSNAANVVDSFTITYKGKLQKKPNGIAINGTQVAYWFGGDGGGGTGRALIADTSDPEDITDVQRTNGISAFGGEWTTEGGEDFLYTVSYTEGRTWKYQLTESVPACADDSGVFHPEQVAPGALAWRVLVEITHEDRPVQPVPELSFDFTEDDDSNGTPWPARTSTEEFTWRVGDRAYSDVLARLIPAGVTFDLDVNTMTLHAYVDADFGTDRTSATFASGKVRFAQATNLAVNGDLGRRDNRGQPDTYITVLGDGGVYGDATLAGRYVREGFMQVSGPSTEAVLDAIGDDELARQRLVSDALGFETLWASDPLAGRYIPKLHYWKGDLVTLDMVAGEFAYNEEELRLYGTLISERDGGWRSAVDLGSAYKIPGPIESIPGKGGADGSSGGGGSRGTTVITSIPLTVSDGEDVNIPRVTRIIADGVTSPEPGVAVIPNSGEASEGLVEELGTDETDTDKRLAPDGLGGVEWVENDSGDFLGRRGGEGHYVVTVTESGAALTLDLSAANWFDVTLTDDCVIAFSNPPESGIGGEWTVILRQDATGGRVVTWPAGVQWQDTDGTSGGPAPTLFTAVGAEDVIVITTLDGGASYGGGREGAGGSSVSGLDDLDDVVLTAPAAGDRLRYDGSDWVNTSLHWVAMVDGTGLVMLDGLGNVMEHEVA
jgi:hypothetical protein